MKNLIVLLFVTLGLSTSAMASECLVTHHSDAAFISAALANISSNSHISDIKLQRLASSEAKVTVTIGFGEKVNLFVSQHCETGNLIVKLNVDSPEFTCQKGWINCMPSIGAPPSRYCSSEYATWAEKNCGGSPMIAQ